MKTLSSLMKIVWWHKKKITSKGQTDGLRHISPTLCKAVARKPFLFNSNNLGLKEKMQLILMCLVQG